VTIYILIPFLVIPQIILSGVIVKFEKLNPNISSPSVIPFYGEVFTARWGYEALAVKQFIDNKFEEQFYGYDKMKSKGNYRRNFWCNDLKLKLDGIINDLNNNKRSDDFDNNLLIVSNEITKELESMPKLSFEDSGFLTPDKITPEIAAAANDLVELLRKYYIDYYNFADDKRNTLIEKLQKENGNSFIKLRNRYHNASLEEFVINKNESTRIVEFNGELVQKMDPIFMDPEYKFIKAHFYSPTKRVFGAYFDTYIINVAVLWSITILLYFALYFRLLKKILDSGEAMAGKRKGSD
jgi:hypothetical protein